MKKLNLCAMLIATLFVTTVSSCKKDEDDTDEGLQSDGQVEIPSDASGALYAVNNTLITDFGGFSDTSTTSTAFAWFDSYSQSVNAGAVTCEGDSLYLVNPFTSTPSVWYTSQSGSTAFSGNTNWNVGGSGAVSAFTHTDNTAWPVVSSLTVPASISSNSPLTVSFIASGYDQLILSIRGNTGAVNKVLASGATSGTFTSAEVTQAIGSNSSVGATIQVMPIKMSSQTYGGKKYYFVKQQALAKFVF